MTVWMSSKVIDFHKSKKSDRADVRDRGLIQRGSTRTAAGMYFWQGKQLDA